MITSDESPQSHLPTAWMAVSRTSETISRNATPSTRPNEISRTRTNAKTLDFCWPANGHTRFSAVLSDENVADAPTASSTNEITAATPVPPLRCAFSTMLCTLAAA